MNKYDLKALNFFKCSDGKDDFVSLQLNCMESSIYNILKNSVSIDKSLITSLFIRDINPALWLSKTDNTLRINNAVRRQKILLEYLNRTNGNTSVKAQELLGTLRESISRWTVLEKHMNRILQSKANNLNSKTAAMVMDIIQLESNLHNILTNYV